MAFQISLTSTKSEIIRDYNPEGIILRGPYEVGLKHFTFWNVMHNITKDNNTLILVDPKGEKYEIHLDPGYYEIDDMISSLHTFEPMVKSKTIITLSPNTLKIKIKSHWTIHFSSPNSIGKVLGFSQKHVITPDKIEMADSPCNISSINTVKIHCNLVSSNIEDLKRNTHILYDFPLDFDKVGSKLIKEPNPILYFQVNTSIIYELVIRITDQDNRLLDLNEEETNLTLDFRPL